ncbi:hypothetical protein F5Y15DRAFT_395413 [Xylariaceae sp. FL0016]|nr:hypothetical protein F5Y15DRAFT_395413 [Xylariaceae sp. FL0016]
MRLVSRVLRDVKPTRSSLNSPACLWSPRPTTCVRRPYHHTLSLCRPSIPFSTSFTTESDDIEFVLLDRDSRHGSSQKLTPREGPSLSLVQDTSLFGRWKRLLIDPERLAIESDFLRKGPAKDWASRLLVDKTENHGDFALWCCLLDFQTRVNGDAGIANVWNGLWGRKSLYDTEGPLAPMFWRLMLEGALKSDDPKFLDSIWIYSEWMYNLHGAKWPHLYKSILAHFLRTHQHQRALQWQLRLTPNFYPGSEEFAELVKQFVTDNELDERKTLRSIYAVNSDRKLYDKLIPYLYDLGKSQLARKWRRTLVLYDDLPMTAIHARPFLRFLQGYYPNELLHDEEITATGDLDLDPIEDAQRPELSREFINRVHGGTFGITVKNYNDKLGAKWFASSWISLDTAMATVSALGIEQIGPLSLQSIALRDPSPEGVLRSISELGERGISTTDSTYSKIVRYLASTGDSELLLDILESDLHPDIFDDIDMQTQLLESETPDPRTRRLLLASRIVALGKLARQTANALFQTCFQHRDQEKLLRVLDDMKTGNIEIDHEQVTLVFDTMNSEYPNGKHKQGSLAWFPAFYAPILQRFVAMDVPIPADRWREVLFPLIRTGRSSDCERILFELVQLFTTSRSVRPGFVPVHLADIPESTKKHLSGVQNLLGVYIPLDLPAQRNSLHPLHKIIDTKLVHTMIRHSFYQSMAVPSRPTHTVGRTIRKNTEDFYCAWAIRLLRVLCDRGAPIEASTVQKAVKGMLVQLYGTDVLTKKRTMRMKANNLLTLGQMKTLVDEAWGRELLPPLHQLSAMIEKKGNVLNRKNVEYLRSKGRRRPRPQFVL